MPKKKVHEKNKRDLLILFVDLVISLILSFRTITTKIEQKYESFLSYLRSRRVLETEERHIEKILKDIRRNYPELLVSPQNTTELEIIKAYYEVQSIERESVYKTLLIWLTVVTTFVGLLTAWVGVQNLQIQKPHFVNVIGQNCPQNEYSYVSHSFSFVNVGKSAGDIIIGYNSNSAEIDLILSENSVPLRNFEKISIRDGTSITYRITATSSITNSEFNFTIYAITDEFCTRRTCQYVRDENNVDMWKKAKDDKWVNCEKSGN